MNNNFYLCQQYFLYLGGHTSMVPAYRGTYHNGLLIKLWWDDPFNLPFNSVL